MLKVILGAILSLSFIGMAQAYAQVPSQVIAFLDRDKDGKVSLDEYLAFHMGKFREADIDGDGSLSLSEFKSSLAVPIQATAGRIFAAFHIDGAPG